MATSMLLVGFDSAWTVHNLGALVGVLADGSGELKALGPPIRATYSQAESAIRYWQSEHEPAATLILLDQPTIVTNSSGQRPVENLVSSPVGRRRGGVQSTNSGKAGFETDAPIWGFLERCGGAAPPIGSPTGNRVIETYPVLALIALGWTCPGSHNIGRLPKYNPQTRKHFLIRDWKMVCRQAAAAFETFDLDGIARWLNETGDNSNPRKADQDRLDASICLLVALYLRTGRNCLMVGDGKTGYMIVPQSDTLLAELRERCRVTRRGPSEWLSTIRYSTDIDRWEHERVKSE